MWNRFGRIHREFGGTTLARVVVLLVGLVAMAVLGGILFVSPWAALVAVVGLVLGFLVRRLIPLGIEFYSWAIPAGLFVYGVVLVAGERPRPLAGGALACHHRDDRGDV